MQKLIEKLLRSGYCIVSCLKYLTFAQAGMQGIRCSHNSLHDPLSNQALATHDQLKFLPLPGLLGGDAD